MKVVFDGVVFQFGPTDVTLMWSHVLSTMKTYAAPHVALLDRGGAPHFDGIERIAFPSYKLNTNTASDSLLLERVCKECKADVFVSTLYTTPTTVPSVVAFSDASGFEPSPRQEQERELAINFASHYVCASDRIRDDLEARYPGTRLRSAVPLSRPEKSLQSTAERWDALADCIHQQLAQAHSEGSSPARQAFVREWTRLRAIQAAVEPCRISDL
jgi:hypothetical protein